MSWLLIDDSSGSLGMRQWAQVDGEGVTLCTEGTNVEDVLDRNARLRGSHGQAPRGDQTMGNHVASIPLWLWEQWCRENPELRLQTPDAQGWLMRRLNNPEYCRLRTFDGRA